MLFNSLTFAIFFSIVLALHYSPFSWRVKKTNLLLAGYIFYGWWNPPFVLLLWLSTVMDWYLAKWIYHTEKPKERKRLLIISLIVNLGLLGFFKYGNFMMDNFTAMMHIFGVNYHRPEWNIVLPVGISFYTFQSLSYTLDVYQRKTSPSSSFLDFALYLSFFPHLVAGPIMRSSMFLPQCQVPNQASAEQFRWGLTFLVVGLFEKMVVADFLLAPVAEKIYDGGLVPGFGDAWLGTLAFAGQIFCDFAGYSTCAIGIALCLGFVIPRNFRWPYAAVGFADFWKRWHISLSTWLKDYVYIPLGGNKRGLARTFQSLMITMFLGGLWHGASWTFVVWGLLHGFYLCAERALKYAFGKNPALASVPAKFVYGALTFYFVNIAWVFFRSDSFSRAAAMLKSMSGFHGFQGPEILTSLQVRSVLLATAAILTVHTIFRRETLKQVVAHTPRWSRGLVFAAFLILIWMAAGEDRAFVYFQF